VSMEVSAPNAETVSLAALIAPLWRRRRLLFGIPVALLVGAVGVSLLLPRQYEASTMVAAVSPARPISALGSLAGAAAALGGITLDQTGITSTPDFIASLLLSRRILTNVGLHDAGLRPGLPLIDVVRGEPVEAPDIARLLKRIIDVDVATITGLVTLTVRHRDSAVAREVNEVMLQELRRSFSQIIRQQAEAMQLAQTDRVDSARKQLTNADVALRRFLQANRAVAEYSTAAVERDRLRQDLDLAQAVYRQAVTDREGATARALQDVPAVVVVDPLPSWLPLRPRYLVLIGGLAFTVGLIGTIFTIYARDFIRSGHDLARSAGPRANPEPAARRRE